MHVAENSGLLRSREFDAFFIVGIPLIAIASGVAVTWNNDLFLPVLAADLWLLGYHHVISTYTRLAFDSQSFRENRWLVVYMLPAVAVCVGLLALFAGAWAITTIYLYWQWWHYTRQSEGISKAYLSKSRSREFGSPFVLRAAFYAVPIATFLAVSYRSPALFLFFPLRTLPVPYPVVYAAALVAIALVVMWALEQFKAYRNGKLALPYVLYVSSHFLIYYVAYVFLQEIDYGWLTINIWHNAQYILFVWLYNNRRFSDKPIETGKFLSTISQNGRFVLYMATCLTISTGIYFFITSVLSDAISAVFTITATMTGLIIYQTINFHHYIVDSLIWKLRTPTVKRNLGLN